MDSPLPSLFSQPYFKRFIVGQFASVFAFQMISVTLGWQMYSVTHSALDLGLIGLFQFIPQCLLVLATGYVADHFNRKSVARLFQLVECSIAVILALASHYQLMTKELLLACASLIGAARAFESPALQSLLPTLLTPDLLPKGLTSRTSAVQCAVVLGPALGGLAYIAGAECVYGLAASFFLIASICIAGIHTAYAPQKREPVSLKTLTGGIQYIFHNRIILAAMSLDLFSVLLGGAVALLPIFAKDILHVGSEGLGLLRACPSVGALMMSWVILKYPLNNHVGKLLLGAVAVFGLSTILFGVSTSFKLSLFALLILGAADMISIVVRSSLVQLETPNEMRGRVMAVNSIFIGASNQLGEFESGVTAAWLGTVPAVVWGGLGTLLIVLIWTKLFPDLVKRNTLQREV